MKKNLPPIPPSKGENKDLDKELWLQVTKRIKPLSSKNKILQNLTSLQSSSYCSPQLKLIPFVENKQKNCIKRQDLPNKESSCPRSFGRAFSNRLDLHGLSHDKGYEILKDFIRNAFLHNIRKVMIITGKGKSTQPDFMTDRPEKGDIFQTQVPRWLMYFPEVQHFQWSSIKKGGEGALEVTLKIYK
jgi:DNA-nicking Smr family endonuclease